MAEQILLTTPSIIPAKTTSTYKVARLLLDPEHSQFLIIIRGNEGEIIEAHREGQVAVDLMRALNKANNAIKSMERRALEWLQSQPEGISLIGNITGTPD